LAHRYRQVVNNPNGHGGLEAVAYSPAGNILATASDDGTARLWDVNPRADGLQG
jgi:WD40 repeat protein